jgi:hypothetical protein
MIWFRAELHLSSIPSATASRTLLLHLEAVSPSDARSRAEAFGSSLADHEVRFVGVGSVVRSPDDWFGPAHDEDELSWERSDDIS